MLLAVFTGTTFGDQPVSERRGSRPVYRKSARDAFLSANGIDPSRDQLWTGLTDQPNQNRRRKKSPDPTHLDSVDGSYASRRYPKEVPAEPGASNETDVPGRKVMSSETENFMNG
jgi:hypothetical protein